MARYIDESKLIQAIIKERDKIPLTIHCASYELLDEKPNSVGQSQRAGIRKALRCIAEAPTADVVEVPQSGIGDLSDGYHTFNELYHHRAILFSVICNMFPDKAWKSKLHETGDMYDGMFIVGIETEQGQATYHYDIEPYWDMFKVKELAKAPKWDGHTPSDAIERIALLGKRRHGYWKPSPDGINPIRCSECNMPAPFASGENEFGDFVISRYPSSYCPHCGAKMDGGKNE